MNAFTYRKKLIFGEWNGGWQVVRLSKPVDDVICECASEATAQIVTDALNQALQREAA